MMKESYKFVNKELGNIRTLENNGTTWFIAKDICSIITSVPVASVLKRVNEENKAKLNLGLGGKYTNVVNTDGLFQILDGGQTEKARILKQWIVSEVLPSLEVADMTIEEEDMVPLEETIPFDEADDCFTPAIHEEPSAMEDEIDLTIIDGQIMVSSLEVAEKFGKDHCHVLRDIDTLKSDYPNLDREMFKESTYTNTRGKTYRCFNMNRDGFSLLSMGFTGKEAIEWKLKYIYAFNEMERELKRLYNERKQWEIERAKGVLVRHILTDTIKMKVTDSPNKKFMYPNYTKLIYKAIFGKSFNELKEQYKIKGKESLRDYLTNEELKEVEQMEMLVSSLIGLGMGYTEIKDFISKKYTSSLLIA